MKTLKLKAMLVETGTNVNSIAATIGMNPATLYRKINGKSQFTADEMLKLKNILHLDFQSFCDIFFGSELA